MHRSLSCLLYYYRVGGEPIIKAGGLGGGGGEGSMRAWGHLEGGGFIVSAGMSLIWLCSDAIV